MFIQIITKEKSYRVSVSDSYDGFVLELLRQKNIAVNAVCGGNGVCGKCAVQVIGASAEISDADRKYFSMESLNKGWRLACSLRPKNLMMIRVSEQEPAYEILGSARPVSEEKTADKGEKVVIGIDIGTTTIAMALVWAKSGKLIREYSVPNSQKNYGADVVSRIQAALSGPEVARQLKSHICRALKNGIDLLMEGCMASLSGIVIAGNTTMLHLLRGYSVKGLSAYPFETEHLELEHLTLSDLLGEACQEGHLSEARARFYQNTMVTLLPGFSAFVGADLYADMVAVDWQNKESVNLLIDLGTNGEMLAGCSSFLFTTSSPAGPVFEGAGLEHGVGSVQGAICNVFPVRNMESCGEDNALLDYKTIGNAAPIGICGTGAIELLAALREIGVIDETGYMDERYEEKGYPLVEGRIYITQADIRKLQLAKAAIRAGIEILIQKLSGMGISENQIGNIYIAGGFGARLSAKAAISIGMLPDGFADKLEIIGNGALEGAIRYALAEARGSAEACNQPIPKDRIYNLSLATEPAFEEFFIKYMNL